jgi:hypothetical protein
MNGFCDGSADMTKIPFKSRLPRKAWALAAVGLAFSIASSLAHGSAEPDRASRHMAEATRAVSAADHVGVVKVALPQDCPDLKVSQEQQG